jgi:hypothetical protein
VQTKQKRHIVALKVESVVMKEVVIIDGVDIVPRPRPRRGVARIELSREPVRVRGEELDEVWWRGHQWAVTAHGIECLDGTYHLEARRLLEEHGEVYDWPEHMVGKVWVDIDEFATAWRWPAARATV